MKIPCSNYQYFLKKISNWKIEKKIGVTFNSSSWMFKCKCANAHNIFHHLLITKNCLLTKINKNNFLKAFDNNVKLCMYKKWTFFKFDKKILFHLDFKTNV